MNAELVIQITIGGRAVWMKKKTIDPVLTKKLTDAEYDLVVNAAEHELTHLVSNPAQQEAKKKK